MRFVSCLITHFVDILPTRYTAAVVNRNGETASALI